MMNWTKFWIQGILVAAAFGSLGFLQNLDVKPIGSERQEIIEASYEEMTGEIR